MGVVVGEGKWLRRLASRSGVSLIRGDSNVGVHNFCGEVKLGEINETDNLLSFKYVGFITICEHIALADIGEKGDGVCLLRSSVYEG
jgi:hypothetical protein